jgi:N-methylhydantoinase A
MRVAVEVGGTFTDFIWIDARGQVRTHKVLSTPADPSEALVGGLDEALGGQLPQISHLFHGSTVATNAIIERTGCQAALLVTRGFRDVLLLQRQLRPNVYAVDCQKPKPLIPLERTFEVDARMSADGEILEPLDLEQTLSGFAKLHAAERLEAVAICLLHSYRDPSHERQLRDALQERYPQLPVLVSSEIQPTFREYERTSTTVMASYLAPLVGRYLGRLEEYLDQRAPGAFLFVMQSSGGLLPSGGARNRSVDMLNSGPAAGVTAAVRMAGRIGDSDLITLDVGGTSSDVCLVADGRADVTAETEIDGLPVGRPTLDIVNIGAGGGSIGWIDGGGMLQVGPRSAGARPGPACYGRGGTVPTLTDALVELGCIRPQRFLGGRMTLQPKLSTEALNRLAAPLGQTAVEVAQAMVDITVAHVSRSVRLVSVQRGRDPKRYALYAYGGMGPVIAALSAQELKIRRIVIPPYPGLFSALGLLVADLKRVYRETAFSPVDSGACERIQSTFGRLMDAAEGEFASYGSERGQLRWEYFLEMRHHGQGFELLVEVDLDRLRTQGTRYLLSAFEAVHRERYGTTAPQYEVDIVTYRLVAEVASEPQILDRLSRLDSVSSAAVEMSILTEHGVAKSGQFFARDSIPAGAKLAGPCVIEESNATTLVPSGWSASAHHSGALILEKSELHA